MKNNINKLTPFKLCIIDSFPFIEEDFDAITNYQLLCKVVEYLNKTISSQNEVIQLSQELVNGYNYLLNYFENLDVQDEINNKLDEMAQDGTLTNLIKNYIDPIFASYQLEINEEIENQNDSINSINTLVNEVKDNTDVLSARINSFETLTEGSTTGDAELIDARVGYTGQQYVNLGQAVRSQVEGLFNESSNYVTRTRTINLFNKYNIIKGYYLTGTGGVNRAGSGELSISDYIPAQAGDVIIPTTTLTRVYYNSSKEIVEVRTNTSTNFTCPTNTAYVRFSIPTNSINSYVIFKSTGPSDVTPKSNIPYYTYSISGDNTEIVNARVGYNGQDYPTLKDNLINIDKSLFDETSNYVTRTRTINLFNKYDVIRNYYITGTGAIGPSNDGSFCVSNYIEAVANDNIIPSTTLTRAYYNSSKEVIEVRNYQNNNFICPANTAYIRFTVPTALLNSYVIFKSTGVDDENPKTGIPYYNYSLIGEVNNFANETYKIFRKICCVGDSLTEGYILNSDGVTAMVDNNYSWPHYMETSSNNTYLNCGSSGANTKTWLERTNGLQKAQNFGHVQAYLIGLGFNDGLPYEGYHLDLGTTSDIGTNNPTFYGCMSKIVRELNNISPDAFIFMQTIPSTNTERYNGYNEAIRYICNLYKNTYKTHLLDLYTYIDLYNSPLLQADSSQGHFTAIGYEICSKNLQYIWSKYINDNHEDFRDLPDIPII